jgi:transcriptional regulator with XRE-family HTH domain
VPGPYHDPRPELIALGTVIRQRREAKHWLPERLASEAGVSRVTIVNIERGSYSTGIGTMIDVARALGVRLAQLLDEAGVDSASDE